MRTHEQKLALLNQAKVNITARHGERPRGGKVQHCAAPYPPFDEKRFIADLEATFVGRKWDRLVSAEYARLAAVAGREAA